MVLGVIGGSLLGFAAKGPAASASAPPAADHLYLTIQINPENGWPQFSPANFTVPRGEVIVTIIDYDSPEAWSACPCVVNGTVGNIESVNGTPYHAISKANVAHTFFVPKLGIFAFSPGMSTVTFTTWFNETGSFTWMCVTPCGADGYTGGAMGPGGGLAGYMTGTISVAGS